MGIDIVPYIIGLIVLIQLYFFVKNLRRMRVFKNIFKNENSWNIEYNENKWVAGIVGDGNNVFKSIRWSINKYLRNSAGSVIDFNLLKDAIDRHCDSVENDIQTLTPVPLYCGLAGTMVGVIIGLYALLSTGSITDLLTSGSSNFQNAAFGVNNLLSGVAWAMVASIVGILLTTISSILFKRYKLKGEAGKNSFLAWLQSRLLPELPTDTSDALNRLVNNLNKFNKTFAKNTSDLKGTLQKVNESYRIQADIIQTVHDMDVMKMATANVSVLKELKECTDKLEQFNEYLDRIKGYTKRIHEFEKMFDDESNRLHVLEEIRDFFMRNKAELEKDTADVDIALKDALRHLKDSTHEDVALLHKHLISQAEAFKQIIQEQKTSFISINDDLKKQFNNELGKIPMLEKKLSEISDIPTRLDKLVEKIETSNTKMISQMAKIFEKAINNYSSTHEYRSSGGGFPTWVKWVIIGGIFLIASACITNTIYSIWGENNSIKQIEQKINSTDTNVANLSEKLNSLVVPIGNQSNDSTMIK